MAEGVEEEGVAAATTHAGKEEGEDAARWGRRTGWRNPHRPLEIEQSHGYGRAAKGGNVDGQIEPISRSDADRRERDRVNSVCRHALNAAASSSQRRPPSTVHHRSSRLAIVFANAQGPGYPKESSHIGSQEENAIFFPDSGRRRHFSLSHSLIKAGERRRRRPLPKPLSIAKTSPSQSSRSVSTLETLKAPCDNMQV
ncbi:hypothetical protein [Oryza sativa Japonica Group]|uniref:Uncharacterized protein n=1 Tax=Oryza sativa subsp. japonica TaxID=39947 RepID=Q5JJZ5_ORYSJ|nr:hypothetical protein [Oryza sativa Japonica Group]